MSNLDILIDFFDAENNRDWDKYKSYLHADIEWVLFSAAHTQQICGIEAYIARIVSAYGDGKASFVCEKMYESQSGNRVAAILLDNHGHRSIDIFDFENGLIKKEYEFLLNN